MRTCSQTAETSSAITTNDENERRAQKWQHLINENRMMCGEPPFDDRGGDQAELQLQMAVSVSRRCAAHTVSSKPRDHERLAVQTTLTWASLRAHVALLKLAVACYPQVVAGAEMAASIALQTKSKIAGS